MRNQITLTWNPYSENETSVSYSLGYTGLSRLERLDFLKDAIGILQNEYDRQIKKIVED